MNVLYQHWKWLNDSQSERMDATVGTIFQEDRRRAHLARYEFAARHADGRRVADIACGTGYGTEILSRAGALSVIGIDRNGEAIQYAGLYHSTPSSLYRTADAAATKIDTESIDLVVSFETLEHVDSDEKVLEEFVRILGPEGTLICSVPHLWTDRDLPHHKRVYDRHRLHNLLACYFRSVQLFNQYAGDLPGVPAGIVPTDDENVGLAEWLIAVCRGPIKE